MRKTITAIELTIGAALLIGFAAYAVNGVAMMMA